MCLNGISITKKLGDLFIKADQTWKAMEKMKHALEALEGQPVDLPSATLILNRDSAQHHAKVTGMEANLIEAFALFGEKRSNLLKGYATSMGKHRIAPDDLDPRIWEKAQGLLGGSRVANSHAARADEEK